MKNAATCDHDNIEELADDVQWCPDCGSQFTATRERIARVRALFMEKLAKRYPDHPWIELEKRHSDVER